MIFLVIGMWFMLDEVHAVECEGLSEQACLDQNGCTWFGNSYNGVLTGGGQCMKQSMSCLVM